MPAEQGLGLEDQERFSPMREAMGQEQEPEAVGRGEARFLGLTAEDEELLAEEGILGNQVSFTEHEIDGRA